jgi:hypothetical protein
MKRSFRLNPKNAAALAKYAELSVRSVTQFLNER